MKTKFKVGDKVKNKSGMGTVFTVTKVDYQARYSWSETLYQVLKFEGYSANYAADNFILSKRCDFIARNPTNKPKETYESK